MAQGCAVYWHLCLVIGCTNIKFALAYNGIFNGTVGIQKSSRLFYRNYFVANYEKFIANYEQISSI